MTRSCTIAAMRRGKPAVKRKSRCLGPGQSTITTARRDPPGPPTQAQHRAHLGRDRARIADERSPAVPQNDVSEQHRRVVARVVDPGPVVRVVGEPLELDPSAPVLVTDVEVAAAPVGSYPCSAAHSFGQPMCDFDVAPISTLEGRGNAAGRLGEQILHQRTVSLSPASRERCAEPGWCGQAALTSAEHPLHDVVGIDRLGDEVQHGVLDPGLGDRRGWMSTNHPGTRMVNADAGLAGGPVAMRDADLDSQRLVLGEPLEPGRAGMTGDRRRSGVQQSGPEPTDERELASVGEVDAGVDAAPSASAYLMPDLVGCPAASDRLSTMHDTSLLLE
jgi:hypothetical protein